MKRFSEHSLVFRQNCREHLITQLLSVNCTLVKLCVEMLSVLDWRVVDWTVYRGCIEYQW
jgi:hypothetical protein